MEAKLDPGVNLGSLLRLFKSEHFNCHMAITYLYKYSESKPICDYLANEFYSMDKNEIDYYLPQLCAFLVSHEKANSLERFLLDKCATCIHFALKITWLFSALVNLRDKEQTKRCEKLRSEAELATYNCRRPGALPNSSSGKIPDYVLTANPDVDPILLTATSKMQRCAFFKNVQNFSECLSKISDELRVIPLIERNEMLKKKLSTLNTLLRKHPGIYIPLAFANQCHKCIVRIPYNEAIALNSRDRAPFLILVEYIETTGVTNADEHLHNMVLQYSTLFANTPEALPQPLSTPSTINDTNVSNGPTSEPDLEVIDGRENKEIIHQQVVEKEKKENTDIKDTSENKENIGQEETKNKDLPQDQWNIIEQPIQSTNQGGLIGMLMEALSMEPLFGEGKPKNSKLEELKKDSGSPLSPRSADKMSRKKSILYVRETWSEKVQRIKNDSPFGSHPHWGLSSLIVKFGDDCRQERFALQLVGQFHRIFTNAKLPLYIAPYDILVLSPEACLIETVKDAMSIHQFKEDSKCSLLEHFTKKHGGIDTVGFKESQCNFIESVAGYSLITYILQVKDRHNGNILIDNNGHVVHIDFGFVLGNSPGGINFETSPFKLPQEYIDFMGGLDGPMWQFFQVTLISGFLELRKHYDEIVGLIDMMLKTHIQLPSLKRGEIIVQEVTDRFFLGKTQSEAENHIIHLIAESIDNLRTEQYDHFQYLSNGILYL
jgi:phosphatidylinositol 4-kinase